MLKCQTVLLVLVYIANSTTFYKNVKRLKRHNVKKVSNTKNNTKWDFRINNNYINKNKIIKINNEK